MRQLFAGILATVALQAGAAELTQVDQGRSSIRFLTRQMNVPMEGGFRSFTARIAIDPAKPENGRATITIDVASIDSGSRDGDEEAQGKDWFDTARHPKASFVSSSVKALGGGKYQALGTLTIKGKSKAVSAPFTLRQEGTGLWFEGALPMRRLEFGVGSGTWGDTDTVANEVQVRFKFFVTQ